MNTQTQPTIRANRRGITIALFRVGVPAVDRDLLAHIILEALQTR